MADTRDNCDPCDDPRNDGVQELHADDPYAFARGYRNPAEGDHNYFLNGPGRSTDRARTEYRGYDTEQAYVDGFRASEDESNTPLDLGHPLNIDARADQYARSSTFDGGKPFNRRRG
jgi:hypothetical protein